MLPTSLVDNLTNLTCFSAHRSSKNMRKRATKAGIKSPPTFHRDASNYFAKMRRYIVKPSCFNGDSQNAWVSSTTPSQFGENAGESPS
jgi:hypothetical protein